MAWTVDALIYSVDRPQYISFPSILSNSNLPGQDQQGRGISSADSPGPQNCVSLNFFSEADEASNPLTHTQDIISGPKGQAHHWFSKISRLACLRRFLHIQGLSERVIEILRSSWRKSTESSYSGAWTLWDCWCIERCIDPLSAHLNEVLEFLLEEFETGKQYRTINAIRSAISMTHNEVDGTRIGQHPLVSRFLKGVFNCRPPASRYSCTWNVDIVLSYVQTLPDNESRSFHQLSHKLVMLMALAN